MQTWNWVQYNVHIHKIEVRISGESSSTEDQGLDSVKLLHSYSYQSPKYAWVYTPRSMNSSQGTLG